MDSEVAKEVVKAIAKETYEDGGKPIVKPTGELVGLVPRAIKAALAPVEKWVLQKEYNIAETKRLLEEKLNNVPPEYIVAPEAHIAVPAMQYISYCQDNDELRNMYANLLASSMISVVKNGVHPGFVEIIKQLSPDEAKILRYISKTERVPTITVRYENNNGEGIEIIENFSNIGELSDCENPLDINKYFTNLIRLGLLEKAPVLSSLTKKELYDPLKNNKYILSYLDDERIKGTNYNKARIMESYMTITEFGKSFCEICIQSPFHISVY